MIDKPDKQKILKLFNTNNSGVVSVTQGTAYTNYKDPVSHIYSKHTPIQAHLPAYTQMLKITQANCGSKVQLQNFFYYIRTSSGKHRQA